MIVIYETDTPAGTRRVELSAPDERAWDIVAAADARFNVGFDPVRFAAAVKIAKGEIDEFAGLEKRRASSGGSKGKRPAARTADTGAGAGYSPEPARTDGAAVG